MSREETTIKDWKALKSAMVGGAEQYIKGRNYKDNSSVALKARLLKTTLFHGGAGLHRASNFLAVLKEIKDDSLESAHVQLLALLFALYSPKLGFIDRLFAPGHSTWLVSCVSSMILQGNFHRVEVIIPGSKASNVKVVNNLYSSVFKQYLLEETKRNKSIVDTACSGDEFCATLTKSYNKREGVKYMIQQSIDSLSPDNLEIFQRQHAVFSRSLEFGEMPPVKDEEMTGIKPGL